jgi:hypothetical protein
MTTRTASPDVTKPSVVTVVLHVGCQYRASERVVVEAALGRYPGIVSV